MNCDISEDNKSQSFLKYVGHQEKKFFLFLVFTSICVHYYIFSKYFIGNDHIFCEQLYFNIIICYFSILFLLYNFCLRYSKIVLLPLFLFLNVVTFLYCFYTFSLLYSKKFLCHFNLQAQLFTISRTIVKHMNIDTKSTINK